MVRSHRSVQEELSCSLPTALACLLDALIGGGVACARLLEYTSFIQGKTLVLPRQVLEIWTGHSCLGSNQCSCIPCLQHLKSLLDSAHVAANFSHALRMQTLDLTPDCSNGKHYI